MEGPLRRKTLLKEGRKPAVSAEGREGKGSRDRPTRVPALATPQGGQGLGFHICKLG